MKYRWSIAEWNVLQIRGLTEDLAVSPWLAQCLLNRGLTDSSRAGYFLEPRLRSLEDPFRLPGMRSAVDRLYRARVEAERVVIFGDYDVDGMTATALLTEVLRALGWCVEQYLPHRMGEGYGLSPEAVATCVERCEPSVMLAVDCGSTSTESIRWLGEIGVDTVVLDHHQVSAPAPPAVALINPLLLERIDDPARNLCSAGLAFKLAHALVKEGRLRGMTAAMEYDVRPLLDLAGMGTVADMVPLTGENRIVAAAGLDWLNRTERPGLRALKAVSQTRQPLGVYDVGFQLGPRLNAAGRLEAASEALELLLCLDPVRADVLARKLDMQNRERQRIERVIAQEAIDAVQARFDPVNDYVIVEGRLPWHIGIVGIVASRVQRVFHRPTIILGGNGGEWRGSGRSIEGFDLAAALRECDDLLLRHGGHAMAAGLTMRPECIEPLRMRLNGLARRSLAPEQLQPELRLDGMIPLGSLTVEQVAELERLEPVGQGNPPVQFAVAGLRLQKPPRRMGKEEQHAKLWVTDGRHEAEAVWWNCDDAPMPSEVFDLAVAPHLNHYNGRTSIQLRVLDWRQAVAADESLSASRP
jgi:single-stranded-DNA-specific exonuclease